MTSEELADAEKIARLERTLRKTPRRQREIFLAIRFDGLSYTEVTERTELSIRLVQKHFAKGLAYMADVLDRPLRKPAWKQLSGWFDAGKEFTSGNWPSPNCWRGCLSRDRIVKMTRDAN